MNSTAFDEQFAVCTPEEEEFFRDRQKQQDEKLISEQCAQRTEDARVDAIGNIIRTHNDNGINTIALAIDAAIKAGRIPGVVLGSPHE